MQVRKPYQLYSKEKGLEQKRNAQIQQQAVVQENKTRKRGVENTG